MSPLDRNRRILELGKRAIAYYVDTGFCVFCDADDVVRVPHEDCDVGELSGVKVTAERREEKRDTRELLTRFQAGTLTRAELEDFSRRHGTGPFER